MIKKIIKNLKLIIILSALIVSELILFFDFTSLDRKMTDILFNIRQSQPAPDNILLVWIDDDTLKELNTTFPFDRKYFAQAIEILNKNKAKAAAIDFLFTETGIIPDSDKLLEKTIYSSKIPIIIASEIGRKLQKSNVFELIVYPIFKLANWGFITSFSDKDSFTRSFIPAIDTHDIDYALMIKTLQLTGYNIKLSNNTILTENKSIKLDKYGQIPINFYKKDYKSISFVDLLKNNFPENTLNNKYIIISVSFTGSKDFYYTPIYNKRFLGGELHANILDMFLNNDFIFYPNFLFNFILLFLISIFFFFFKIKHPFRILFYSLIVLSTLFFGLFFIFNIVIFIFTPFLLVLFLNFSIYFLFRNNSFKEIINKSIFSEEDISSLINNIKFLEKYNITKAEKNILNYLVLTNLSGPTIAKKFFISPTTIKTHTANIYKKFDINKRSDLINIITLNMPFFKKPQ